MSVRSGKIERARFEILRILKENDLHIELGLDWLSVNLFLCENESHSTRDFKKDIDLNHYMSLSGANTFLKEKYNSSLFYD